MVVPGMRHAGRAKLDGGAPIRREATREEMPRGQMDGVREQAEGMGEAERWGHGRSLARERGTTGLSAGRGKGTLVGSWDCCPHEVPVVCSR